MAQDRTFYLIDGSSYIYRAFYALTRLTSPQGMPTQAVYGFAQMLVKVMREQQPDYVCVVFDAPGPSFRLELYEEYKANRQKMPEDLVVQVPYIKELVRCQGIPQLEYEGYEADDLIAALTRWGREEGLDVVIVSGDKDLMQLVEDPHVRQWDPQKDKLFGESQVFERYGVTPGQMRDFLALMGDSSDNVPGVKGVGEKTAKQLLQDWGSLDAVFANLEEIKSASVRKKLEQSRDLAYLSLELVSFKEDAAISKDLQEFTAGDPEKEALLKLYEKLGFKSLLQALREEWGIDAAAADSSRSTPRRDHIVTTEQEFAELLEAIAGQERISVDLETTSTDPMRAELVGIAISWEDHVGYYLPLGHSGENSQQQLDPQRVLRDLQPILSRPQPGKVGQNIKYEWVVFKCHGIDLQGIDFDTMVANYLLDPGKYSHSLDNLAMEHLGEKMISYTDVTGKGKSQIGFAEVDVVKAADYACEDAEITWRLAPILLRKLTEQNLQELYETLELPLIEVLAEMEYHGVLVDAEQLELLSGELDAAMEEKAAVIYDLAKEEFNIQSPKQLATILFEKLGLRVVKRTKSGPSTDMSVLEELAGEHPIAEQVLAYRSLSKLKGTYADALPKLIHPQTKRIHTSYNQTVAATGRLSSSDPNLQNIPIRTPEGRRIREAFVAAPDHVLLSADYSQVELRILAHYSQDRHLLDAFREGADVHRRTAAEMFGIPPHDVTPEMRRQAKAINFGIIYGMGAFGLARRLGVNNKTAKDAIDRYFEHYEGVRRFIDEMIHSARESGYTETLLGRRRAIPELQSRNRNVQQQGERLAINTPIQGTAADLIKKAMIDIHRALKESDTGTIMLLQVHDELVFEVPEAELDSARQLIKEHMEQVWSLSVPLDVDMGWGGNWAEAHL